jgi:hypothetical protein
MKFTSESAGTKWMPGDMSKADLDRGYAVVPAKTRPEYACADKRLGIGVPDGMPAGEEVGEFYDD